MDNKEKLLKYRQTILMVISLMLTVGFFLPWFKIDPNFNMFGTSKASFSGFSLVMGIGFAVKMISAFGKAYDFPASANIVYLGYILIFIPLLGVASIVLSGIKHKKAMLLHTLQYSISLVVFFVILIVSNINKDMKELIDNVTNTSFGFYLSFMLALMGVAYVVYYRISRRK